MFKYLNCSFWQMLAGFLAILAVAIGLLFYLGFMENSDQAPNTTNFAGMEGE